MEIVNIMIIFSTSMICIIWAIRRKKELESMKIEINDENMPLDTQNKKNIIVEQEDLTYISQIYYDTILALLKKIYKVSLVIFTCLSLMIWIFLEEKFSNFSQGIYFFIGASSQIFIGLYIFKSYNIFDPKMILFARVNKWFALEHVIKLNNYITLTNQAMNLIIFSITYYLATFFGIDLSSTEISERDFEKFHRRFLAYGLGSITAYFIIKSLGNMFNQGSFMVCEILARQTSEGIEEDHPKNPAKIINNISNSFFIIFQNALEFNALTNMGLCIFQDFFVTRSVYLLDRGFLNSIAIYSFGMLGSLLSMIYFQKANKLKMSDSNEISINLKKMKKNGLKSIFMSTLTASFGALFVMWNTFPDSIAVYNPFERKIQLRNLNNIDSFIMFITSSLLIFSLILNSLYFTVRNSTSIKNVMESSKVCFSLTLLSSDYWSCYAQVFPLTVFFIVLYLNYSKGNIYGVTMEYLGILTYFQCIQFFQNFKNILYFFKALIEARNIQDQVTLRNIEEIDDICQVFGKFSTGVNLFIQIILCFVILVDSFNIQIVKEIIVIEPGYILGVVSGSMLFYCLTGLEIKTQTNFVQRFLKKIKTDVMKNINEEDYEPPIKLMVLDLLKYTFANQILIFYLPTIFSMGFMFSLFGKKMVVIVMFGAFLLVLLTCYKNLLKAQLLIEMKKLYLDYEKINQEGVDPKYIGLLSNIVGNAYQNYSNDPHSKLLLLFCVSMICSSYYIDNADFLNKMLNGVLGLKQ